MIAPYQHEGKKNKRHLLKKMLSVLFYFTFPITIQGFDRDVQLKFPMNSISTFTPTMCAVQHVTKRSPRAMFTLSADHGSPVLSPNHNTGWSWDNTEGQMGWLTYMTGHKCHGCSYRFLNCQKKRHVDKMCCGLFCLGSISKWACIRKLFHLVRSWRVLAWHNTFHSTRLEPDMMHGL